MTSIVLIHWPGLHHSQVDSAIMDHCVGSWDAELAAVVNGPVAPFQWSYESLEEAVRAFPSRTPVFLVPESDLPEQAVYTRLHEYPHPECAMYVIGADGGFGFDVPQRGEFVVIETPQGLNHSMWSYQIATIVLYDRWLKEQ